MGFYSGADKTAMVGSKSPRLSDFDGSHELKVTAIRAGDQQQIYWAADLEVLSSTNEQLKPGTKLGWVTTRDSKFPQYYFSDIKRFLGALQGQEADSITELQMEASEKPDYTGLGCQVNALVTRSNRADKKTGKPYGNVTFSPAE
jgi:hypothetical protein